MKLQDLLQISYIIGKIADDKISSKMLIRLYHMFLKDNFLDKYEEKLPLEKEEIKEDVVEEKTKVKKSKEKK